MAEELHWAIYGCRGPTNYLIQRSQRAKAFLTHVDKLSRCYGRVNGEWDEPIVSPMGEELDSSEETVMPMSSRPHRTVRRPIRYQ